MKTFHENIFAAERCAVSIREQFFTISHRNVIRGMHFQVPPADHAKLIFCLQGSILDVVLDLRVSQPTFGQAFSVRLTADAGTGLFIPSGFAHGFLALQDNSTALYNVGGVYDPRLDSGIRWDSFAFDWPVENPILSERDQKFPALADWPSPFR